jgi:hypothetical protein
MNNPLGIRCLTCGASMGARCRTISGRYASLPHVARLIPRFTCPRCGLTTIDPFNIAHGYCSSCHDWTGDTPADVGQEGFDI